MPSKDVLKEAIRAFDGTAIIVSHDREFLDGLVTKVYEFGGGKVREHIGGIYDFLQSRKISSLNDLSASSSTPSSPTRPAADEKPATQAKASYAERKEQQKLIRKTERAVEESEKKIAKMEQRLKELDTLLCDPKNAADMTLVGEYTDTKRSLDEEVERWEKLSEELEKIAID
jgi:ATP-binding cassette subfamily F protein 3